MNGDKYEGGFRNDLEDGQGVKIFHGHPIFLAYTGSWSKGQIDGRGIASL